MPSSSNRSTSIPSSFDRFRGKSIQFLSPFRHHHYETSTKQSSERSWIRKTQVHPNVCLPAEHNSIDHNATHLFHANSKTPTNKKRSKNLSDTRSSSNIIGITPSKSCPPPTPYMIGYRQSSLPSLIPTRILKRPQTFNDLAKQSNVDEINN